MKRLLAFAGITVVFCGISGAVTFGPQGAASTPDAEFITLSDIASLPVAGTAGDAMAPAQETAPVAGDTSVSEAAPAQGAAPLPEVTPAPSTESPQEKPVVVTEEVKVVSPEAEVMTLAVTSSVVVATNVISPEVVATEVVETVKQATVSPAASNGVDSATEMMPVESFSGTSGKQNLISVALDDVPLQDVVRLFTRISGANIISSSTNLQGKVTVNLQDVEWRPALDSILDMYNLMVAEKVPGSGIYSVMTKAPGTEPLIAQPIFLDYAPVSNVVAVLSPMVGKGGMISPFPNANAIVVRATAADLSAIMKVITEIDVPRQQVYIEAKFLELTDEAIKDLGINWQMLEGYGIGVKNLEQAIVDKRTKFNENTSSSDRSDLMQQSDVVKNGNSATFGDSTKDGLSSSVGSSSGRDVSDSIEKTAQYNKGLVRNRDQTVTDIRTAVLSADDFRVVLSALQQINGISVVSNPKIIVANQETATIHIGQNEPNIKGTVTAGQQGQANTVTYALDPDKPYFAFGISLEVTPTINNQSNISVRIMPTLSRHFSDKVAPDGITYPVEATKTIKTVFSMESGKTAAIGGLTETDERDNVVKIPVLGDIPLIGKYLFSYTHKQHTKTETIIFVTVGLANPKTLQRDEGLPEESDLAQKHMVVSKQLRDKRTADAAKAAALEKAAKEKAAKAAAKP